MNRRHRVVLRPKVRGQRRRRLAAFAALAVLGAGAAAVAKHSLAGVSWRGLPRKISPGFAPARASGVPAMLAADVDAFLAAQPADASAAVLAAALSARFPWIRTVEPRREWLRRRLALNIEPRRALARAPKPSESGQRPGAAAVQGSWLDDEGVVFAAPAGYAPETLPVVHAGRAGSAQLKSMSGLLSALAPESLPAALGSCRFISESDGWELSLADGTRVLWGDGRWTAQKLSRLREALGDARSEGGPFAGTQELAADLRYFEDGKILVSRAAAGVLR